MNITRGVAALLAGSCVAYEVYALKEQERTLNSERPLNNTWSQITRDIPGLDTLVGRTVFSITLHAAADWFDNHITSEGSSSAPLHRQEG